MTYERVYRYETGLNEDCFKNFITNLPHSFAWSYMWSNVLHFYAWINLKFAVPLLNLEYDKKSCLYAFVNHYDAILIIINKLMLVN